MANPIIADVTRGTRVESAHRGAYVVVDAAGAVVEAGGDVAAPVFPRSALKLLQALPLVESGAADAHALTTEELAMAGASHSSEPGHVACVRGMLARIGLDEAALGCGAHWPLFGHEPFAAMACRGEAPTRAHNNCSGKHAGFLLASHALGAPAAGYLERAHPIQAEARHVIETLGETTLGDDFCGSDGCSAPTYALPLENFARAFARLAAGVGVGPERAKAAERLMQAAMAAPWHVAGTGRACTDVMRAAQGRLYAKTGAEGVYVAVLPEEGLAMAMKCEDGAARAVEVLLGRLAARYLKSAPAAVVDAVAAFAEKPVKDWNGAAVGAARAAI